MNEHTCTARAHADGTMVIRGSGGMIETTEFRFDSQQYDEFTCSCGAGPFEGRASAERHVQEASRLRD